MYLLTIILIIACIYFYRKSKKKQSKHANFGEITYAVSGSLSKDTVNFPQSEKERSFTRLILRGEDLGRFIFFDSPDKSYRILWRRSGYTENENEVGAMAVMNGGEAVFRMNMPYSDGIISNRERSATISNNGVFAITISPNVHKPENIIKIGNPTRGFFSSISTHAYTDKIYISENGIYLIVETGGSQDDDLRKKLIVIDIEKKEIIGKIPRRHHYSTDIQIFETERLIHFWYGKDSIVIDFNGETINEKYKLQILLDAVGRDELHDFKTAYSLFEEKKDKSYAENLIRALSAVNPLDVNVSGDDISKAYRLLAEYYENSDIQTTVQYYERALEYNQRAGVKRKIKELQDKINN